MNGNYYLCKSKDLNEIDGNEHHIHTLTEMLCLLEGYKEVHIQDENEDIDLWIRVVG